MSQDILSFGLDVSSFDAKKKKTLNEFIELFNKLSEYDGKKISPIALPGLADFNKSVKETTSSLDALNKKLQSVTTSSANVSSANGKVVSSNSTVVSSTNKVITKYEELEALLKKQDLQYKNLVLSQGKNSAAAKAMALELNNTASTIVKIERASDIASKGGVDKLSRGLTHGLSLLRTMAYILPGLGIAGIFNIAGEAILNTFHAMGLFTNEVEKTIDREKSFNSILSEQIGLFEELIKLSKDYSNSFDNYSLRKLEENYGNIKAIGGNKKSQYEAEASINSESLLQASRELVFNRTDGRESRQRGDNNIPNDKEIKEALDRQKYYQDEQIKLIEKTKQRIASIRTQLETSDNTTFLGFGTGDTDKLKKELDKEKSVIDAAKAGLAESKRIVNSYNSALQKSYEDALSFAKYLSDERRKQEKHNAQERIETEKQANESILKSELEFQDRKLSALKKNLEANKRSNIVDENFVLKNNSSSDEDKDIATQKRIESNKRLEIKYAEDVFKVKQEFYQRLIKAQLGIDKSYLEAEAIKNEKIFNDDNKSLEQRLFAYKRYISIKQKIEDEENAVGMLRGASSSTGKTSLTKEEKEEIQSKTNERKISIQANTEREIYNIVSSSLDKELKLIKNANSLEYDENNKAYLKELIQLNDLHKNKLLSIKQYNSERKLLEDKYKISGLDQKISRDEEDVFRLQQNIRKNFSRKIDSDRSLKLAEVGVLFANFGIGDKIQADKNYSTQLGKNKAINDSILKAQKELDDALITLDKDKVKRAEINLQKEIDKEQKYLRKRADNLRAAQIVESAIFDAVKTYGDAIYDERLKQLEAHKALINEGLNAEISAIEKSSLSQKNKIALDIQLNAQKEANDKNAALAERKLKREQAQFDKTIAAGKIIANTAIAVTANLSSPILAAAYAAAGAIELATVMATPIPYKDGTPKDGHPGGLAKYGEAGPEIVKEPYKSPYLVTKETISFLPKGTDVIPIRKSPFFETVSTEDTSWEQTMFLANTIRKNSKEVKNVFRPKIYVDTSFTNYKKSILGR